MNASTVSLTVLPEPAPAAPTPTTASTPLAPRPTAAPVAGPHRHRSGVQQHLDPGRFGRGKPHAPRGRHLRRAHDPPHRNPDFVYGGRRPARDARAPPPAGPNADPDTPRIGRDRGRIV